MDQSLELKYMGKDPIQNQQCGKSEQYHEGINKHGKNNTYPCVHDDI